MRRSTLEIAKPKIIRYFDDSSLTIYQYKQIAKVFKDNRSDWDIAESISVRKFIDFLLAETDMERLEALSPYKPFIRYGWGSYSKCEFALSLRSNSYLSHGTAAQIHQLSSHKGNEIFVNKEQSKKGKNKSTLRQENIDAAFSRAPRVTNYVVALHDYKIFLLNGMYTDRYGVISHTGPSGETVEVTDIERTLIDISVRPHYAGGAKTVLDCYRNAGSKISVERLLETLNRIGYVYPYHQVIGFYLDRAGVYSGQDIDLFKGLDIRHDFYLAHNMEEVIYSEDWRLYYPKDL